MYVTKIDNKRHSLCSRLLRSNLSSRAQGFSGLCHLQNSVAFLAVGQHGSSSHPGEVLLELDWLAEGIQRKGQRDIKL